RRLSAAETTLATTAALVPESTLATLLLALIAAAEAAATLLATTAEALAAALPTGAGVAGDLGGSELEGRADLVDLDLVHGATLTITVLVAPLAQPALHDDAHALAEGLHHVLRRFAPDVAGEEQALAVGPLARVLVEIGRASCRARGAGRG